MVPGLAVKVGVARAVLQTDETGLSETVLWSDEYQSEVEVRLG